MIPAQYISVFEKLGFSVTNEGHEFDTKKHDLLARHAAELAALDQEYDALATTEKPAKLMNILRFSIGDNPRPDASARHHEYVANKHREGKNAFNPLGGMLTPSSHEVGGTSGLLSSFGAAKPKIKKASYGDPDYHVDSQERALEEVNSNRKDQKSTLSGLFKNTNSVEKHQTKTMDKVLPGKKEKETGNPLLKTAMTTPHYRAVVRLALKDEIEKIAAFV
jgi:hypothetical protein